MMYMTEKKNRIIALLAATILLTGCGGQTEGSVVEETVELIEPVGISANYDIATYRDMCSYDQFSTVVSPHVEEYAFTKDHVFKKYAVAPGDSVEKDDPLVYSETRDIDKQIEEIDEKIADMEADHITDEDALQKDIKDAKEAEFKVGEGLASMYQFEPDKSDQAAHDGWAARVVGPQIAHKRAIQGRERLEQSLKELNEMYELDHQFQLDTKSRLQNQITDATIQADTEGVVVNCLFLTGGENLSKDVPMVAVGDLNTKVLKTAYIAQNTIAKAEDVYAFINGKRYEVVYEPIDHEEYNRLEQDGQTIYSTFYLQDPDDEVPMGTYAELILVKESRTNVLCVPQDAVKVEKDASYCYLYDGENSTYTTIQTGMKDGIYIEVLEGINPGDKVLSTMGVAMKKNKATLEIGTCSTEFEAGGYMFYPFTEWLENPVDEGKTYVKEIFVENYQPVQEGEVLMTVEVVSDTVEIDRCKRKLDRLATRLEKLQKIKADNDAKKKIDRQNERNITANLAEQKRVQRTLGKLTKYSGVVEVKAPKDGIITDVGYLKAGDLIYSGTKLMQFADSSSRYLVVQDNKAALAFGNMAEVEYSAGSEKKSFTGQVVLVDNKCVSKDLVKEWMLISIPEEIQKELGGATNSGGRWARDLYKAKVQTRSMSNVVLIPKTAVEMVGGTTYVNAIQEDGTVSRKAFMSGGSNNNYFWAISGLSEGMEICWE